ncbi:hypothetical protein P3W85_07930 [Cupriavidus basilensis]|uniref:Chemotaxis protein CheX n=1 Tax=Cupriavidus basilensis TaxID=68895 RepID=A0ABT6AJU4_9BURK|nr:hypothetical protein [Cupriavidus basilensis]MDF3832874.1 hypothetical protein [Cupriavidus basilensis]
MISSRAQDSFERIFFRAAQSRLTVQADDACVVSPARHVWESDAADAEVVVLTISSVVFRLLLVLHFEDDEATRAYFMRDGAQGALREAFVETGNLCCGAVNQDLLRHFPDLGMSTPYVLSAHCVSHLEDLKPDYRASYTVSINASVQLGATVCVFTSAPLDFVADTEAVEESGGELELF